MNPHCAFCGGDAPATALLAAVKGWKMKIRRDGVMFLFCPSCLGRLGLISGSPRKPVS